MSYEGSIQVLCANGHCNHIPEDYQGGPWEKGSVVRKCHNCGVDVVWANHVDETNGPPQGIIDMTPFLVSPEVKERCNLGHEHVVKEALYRIPSKEEAKKARQYFDEY